jgi:hypothetical protein
MVLSISPSGSLWQVEGRSVVRKGVLKAATFQPINIKDGVTDTYAKV